MPAVSRNNFQSLATAAEFEGVDVSFLTVDFINAMNAETGVSNTEMTYMVRTDSVDSTLLATGSDNTIRDAIRAVDTNGRAASATPRNTANFSAATVTIQSLGMTDTGVNA